MRSAKKIRANALTRPEVIHTYKRVESFFKDLLGRDEEIFLEKDFVLKSASSKGYLYYPECFKKLINTTPVKRMGKILQLGTKLYCMPGTSHTRLEHCKGTYYRTLELMRKLYANDEIRKFIKNKGGEKYVLAELVRGLLHDIGHGPFSHTTETVCNLPKGFHEDIGLRMIRENKELRDALNEIYPNLPEIYEETIEKDFLGLNRLFEGQIDVDRGDFLPRDCYFANKKYESVSRNVSELFDNITIEKFVDKDGKTKIAPVFAADQIENLDKFFMDRFKNYKYVYYAQQAKSYDYIIKAFAQELVKSDEDFRLKDFLLHNMNKKPEEIELEEYIAYDDIEYMKGILEVALKTKNPLLKKLAMLSLPPRKSLPEIHKCLMVSLKEVGTHEYLDYTTKSDELFVGAMLHLEDTEKVYEDECLCSTISDKNKINGFIESVKRELGLTDEQLEENGIYKWDPKVVSYKNKSGEETYVKGRDGLIYEYSNHPDRKAPILTESVPGCLVLLPVLESKGYSKEKIDRIREIYNREFNEEELSRVG